MLRSSIPLGLLLSGLVMGSLPISVSAQLPMPPSAAPAAAPSAIAGNWAGTLDVGQALRLVAHITVRPDGSYASTLDSIDQGALGIPVSTITFQNGTVTLMLPNIHGKFVGTLSADGQQMVGIWTQGGGFLPLTLTHTDQIPAGPKRPQEPTPPFPYQSRDVIYRNATGGVTLAGTLTTPSGPGPFPVVLMITGSGPQDRNETLMGHKPFLVIADYLTRRGIAVLRVDDRGMGGSTGSNAQSTLPASASDVRAGIAFLKTQPDIDPHKIGLIGHSEGGLIAPMVAAGNPDVAFIVLLAGPGLTGEQILLMQEQLMTKAMGATPPLLSFLKQQQLAVFAILNQNSDNTRACAKLDTLLQTKLAHLPAVLQPYKTQYRAQFQAQERTVAAPWFRSFLASNPAPTLKRVHCPVLALNGSKDLQVPPREDLAAIVAALKAGGNRDYTTRELPGLNHLFQTAPTGAITEYAQIEETFAPAALTIISDWLTHHVSP